MNWQLDPAADVWQLNCQLSQLSWGRLFLWRLSLFSFSVSLDSFDHPHTHRHLEDLLRGLAHLQQTLLIKCHVPEEKHLSRPSVPDRCERKPLRQTFISHTRGSVTVGADPQLELGVRKWDEQWTLLVLQFQNHRLESYQHWILTDKKQYQSEFHGKESFTATF